MKKKKSFIILLAAILFIFIIVFCKNYFINETSQINNQIIKNCKLYLWKQSPMNFIKIDFKKVSVKKATKEDQEQAEPAIKDTKPLEGDLTVQIGDTQGHDFRTLLIDSDSKKVVGQIPIK